MILEEVNGATRCKVKVGDCGLGDMIGEHYIVAFGPVFSELHNEEAVRLCYAFLSKKGVNHDNDE